MENDINNETIRVLWTWWKIIKYYQYNKNKITEKDVLSIEPYAIVTCCRLVFLFVLLKLVSERRVASMIMSTWYFREFSPKGGSVIDLKFPSSAFSKQVVIIDSSAWNILFNFFTRFLYITVLGLLFNFTIFSWQNHKVYIKLIK